MRLHETEDGAGGIVWVVTFDARWSGTDAAPGARCRWRLFDENGRAMTSGATQLDAVAEVDDRVAVDVYPDEIAGRPVDATVTC